MSTPVMRPFSGAAPLQNAEFLLVPLIGFAHKKGNLMLNPSRRHFLASTATVGASLVAKPALAAREPEWRDATQLAEDIRKGYLSAKEAVEHAVAMVETAQPVLNFLTVHDFERAMEKVRDGVPAGPFGGVPFLIKDQLSYIGLPTRAGSRSRRDSPPLSRQSVYTDAFNRAGLVVLGKTAMPEFGFLPTTEPVAGGPTRNPWDPTRSAGGSSGGAAAAVAAGIVPMAHGSDGGGSLRIPGSCCGLFALKPSRGRMLGTRNDIDATSTSADHVLTRSVRDSAGIFALTEDSGSGARFAPVGQITEPLRRRLRIGLVANTFDGSAPAPDVRKAVLSTAKLLGDLGHEIVPAKWPIGEKFFQDFLLFWSSGAAAVTAQAKKAQPDRPLGELFEPFTLGLADLFAKTPQEKLGEAVAGLKEAAAAYDPWFAGAKLDAVLSPVAFTPPPPLGHLSGTQTLDALMERLIHYAGFTPYHNVAGSPAMSVPLYWTRKGLPIGSQFCAPTGGEALLFSLALQLEAARPWAGKRPKLWFA